LGRRKLLNEKFKSPEDIDISLVIDNIQSKDFCEKCHNTDVRKLKDAMIIFLNTIYMVSDELDLKGKTWSDTCNNLKKWAKERMAIKFAKARKEGKK
jgi:hypothetical protein